MRFVLLSPNPSSYRRSLGVARAKESDTEISGYTPAEYITFSEDPRHACVHAAEAVAAAPRAACRALFDDWRRLVDFFDLVGQIGLDDRSPSMALFQCHYRWAKLPVMEINFLLEKEDAAATSGGGSNSECIRFRSVWGMPLKGAVTFEDADGGRGGGGAAATRVRLELTHPAPNLLLQLGVGPLGLEGHIGGILQENLAEFARLAEAEAGSGGGGGGSGGSGLQQRAEAAAAAAAAAGPSGRGGSGEAAAKQPRRSRAATGGGGAAAAAEPPAPARRRSTSTRRTAASGGGSENGAPPPPAGEGEGAAPAGRRGRPRSTSARGG